MYPNLRGGKVENHFGKTTLSTSNRGSKLDLPVIGSLIYCESSTLDHAGFERKYLQTVSHDVVAIPCFACVVPLARTLTLRLASVPQSHTLQACFDTKYRFYHSVCPCVTGHRSETICMSVCLSLATDLKRFVSLFGCMSLTTDLKLFGCLSVCLSLATDLKRFVFLFGCMSLTTDLKLFGCLSVCLSLATDHETLKAFERCEDEDIFTTVSPVSTFAFWATGESSALDHAVTKSDHKDIDCMDICHTLKNVTENGHLGIQMVPAGRNKPMNQCLEITPELIETFQLGYTSLSDRVRRSNKHGHHQASARVASTSRLWRRCAELIFQGERSPILVPRERQL
uniref:Uncharacterized protein n=1 Tax=Timema bartmani TaxID=61472 RepID=A0A7R9HZ52_9NEOP|nr:unnamed protein product [Timema bartmani]